MSNLKYEFTNGSLDVTFNKFAKQADGSVLVRFNNTTILVTVCENKAENTRDFFPLIVNYEEKLYSVGKIPGNYKRREAQPSEQATLSARMIDRPIRPLFKDGYNNEVQVVCQILSKDENFESDVYATIGVSLSLMIAKTIPFEGPVACVNVGMLNNEFIINPTHQQQAVSEINLKIAGTHDAINMVEASCNNIEEEVMLKALLFGHNEIKKIVNWQNEVIKSLNIEQVEFIKKEDLVYDEIVSNINRDYNSVIKKALCIINKKERYEALDLVFNTITNEVEEEENSLFKKAYDDVVKDIFRDLVIKDKYRVDGRKIDEIRDLSSEIDILPQVHGSALFTRGETQVLNVLTLGLKSDAQTFDGLEFETERRFSLHYNFPPYSVGETGRMGAPGRREIGHGNLARLALIPVLPDESEFPYTIRLVGEVLESNGSSSQATICSGSLALMAGGVPIKDQVAGIAMGLICDENDYTILTDIQGLEDHLGDMDFKVAGTNTGITALQMDIKVKGISEKILEESLNQAKKARLEILQNMNNVISKPKEELHSNVLKVETFKIEEKKIKDVIGRGGESINKIIEQTNVKIDILEDGQVYIYGTDSEMISKASNIINKIAKVYKVDEEYTAKVERIEKYGAFVTFDNGSDALLHVSDLAEKRVENVTDIVNINDIIKVSIKEVDDKNRIKVKLLSKVEDK